jgi:hypothetical protein
MLHVLCEVLYSREPMPTGGGVKVDPICGRTPPYRHLNTDQVSSLGFRSSGGIPMRDATESSLFPAQNLGSLPPSSDVGIQTLLRILRESVDE